MQTTYISTPASVTPLFPSHLRPNFLVIGAGKSGTTSLNDWLGQHPEVFMSPVKEPNYFALAGTEHVHPDKDPDQRFQYPQAIFEAEASANLFADAHPAHVRGEVSPMYLYSPLAAERIAQTLPDIKLIAILRNPVDRLYSRYLHLARENRIPEGGLDAVFEQGNIWWQRRDLVTEGFYATHLSHYLRHFRRDQLRIYTYDDLRANPEALLTDLFAFIGVDPSFKADRSIRLNASGFVKNPVLNLLIGQKSLLKRSIQAILPPVHRRLAASPRLRRWVTNQRNRNLRRPPLDPALRRRLYCEIYQPEIERLSSLIDLDVSMWHVD